MKFDYDLFVIGAGSGGVRAARISANLGAKVAIAEDLYFGGTCVNVGCVPKKLYVYASEFSEEFEAAKGFGWQTGEATHNWQQMLENKNTEITRLNGIYVKLLEKAGVKIIKGKARIVNANTVEVAGQTFTSERILIAVGGWPRKPNFSGAEHVLSSNEMFSLDYTPEKVLVQGGGYIAVEFAGIFNGLGSNTELLYRGDLFLRGFDTDVRKFVQEEVSKKGIKLSFNTDIVSIEKTTARTFLVTLTNGETREVNAVMSAIGRAPKLEGLGLENVQVELTTSGKIKVDENFQTTQPGIYAVGDVVGRKELTPVALAEGMALANHLFANKKIHLDYSAIATAVFCQPNIATVGWSEEQAIAKGIDVDVYVSSFKPMKHTMSGMSERSFMKLVVDKANDRVIGCHMVGAHAGEIIQGIAIAITAGATKTDFDNTIGIHPTAAEEFVTMRSARRS